MSRPVSSGRTAESVSNPGGTPPEPPGGRASPMSATVISPQYCSAGSNRWHGLSWPKVTVCVARMATAGTAPVSAATPDGRSTARTGIDCSASQDARSATGPVNPGRPPIPRMPSTTRSYPDAAGGWWSASATNRPPAASRASRPAECGLPRQLTALTAAPRRASRAAANSASPPLLPGPTSTSTRAPYTAPRPPRSIAPPFAATAAAARCIRASTPCSAMAASSRARTCSTE